MKIGTPPPGHMVQTHTPTGAVRQTARGLGNFANFLRGTRSDGSPSPARPATQPLVEIAAGDNRFSVTTHIGDDAVRFDARPIVGPTATPATSYDATAKPGGPPVDNNSSDIVLPRAVLTKLVVQIADHIPPLLTVAAGKLSHTAPPAATSGSPPRADGAVHRSPFPLAPELPQSRPLIVSVVGAKSPDAAMPVPPANQLLAARVSALPREIVVALCGVTLSSEDMLALADAIRETLAQYRLTDRSLRIFGSGGKR